jgi:hypothetical protein
MSRPRGHGRPRRGGRLSASIALALGSLLACAPGAEATQSQAVYSLAGGCLTLTSVATGNPAPGGAQLRLQATALGSYLLYRPGRDFLAAGGSAVGPAAQPSPAADWVVEDAPNSSFTLSPKSAPDKVLAVSGGNLVLAPRSGSPGTQFRFSPAAGCAVFPEAGLDVSGTPSSNPVSYGQVRGLLDGHMHWMTYSYFGGNFHCGSPWHPYGIPAALPDCSSIEGPGGVAAPMQNFLNFGNPVAPHDTRGYPELTEWRRDNLTYEGTYYRWVQRAWAAGERLIVMPINENRELCQLQANRRYPCDEMTTVRRGLDNIRQLQDYVDAQAGGPGKGFFQIVTDPFEARRVINDGKLAVVLEMEISEPFGCRGTEGQSTCDRAQVDRELQDLYDRGIRSSLLLNKFDNPLSGVRFDSGEIGLLLNAANKDSSGSFWSAETCKGPEHDNEIFNPAGPISSFIASQMTTLGAPPGTLPAYPPAPHCNTRGLTDLGAHVVEEMMSRGMIVNPDHMSQRGVDATLRLAEARHYSGVISPHGWMDPRNWPRIWALGGMAFPNANSSSATDFVKVWLQYRPQRTPYFFGWGFGADLGGLAKQSPPPGSGEPKLNYPFKSLDGAVTVDRQQTGNRTFDFNTEGVAHYGLYADWSAEVRSIGGPAIVDDLLNGPEAYLEMWERSVGVPATHCLPQRGRLTARGLGRIRLGMHDHGLLLRAGQPLTRTRAWTYCVKGAAATDAKRTGGGKGVTAVLTPAGRVALVASSASGYPVRGIHPGATASVIRERAHRLRKGIWVSKVGKRRAAYLVRGKRVRTVAVAGPGTRGRRALRDYLSLVPSTGFTPRRRLVPNRRSRGKVTPRNASALIHTYDPGRHAWYCSIGL